MTLYYAIAIAGICTFTTLNFSTTTAIRIRSRSSLDSFTRRHPQPKLG